jgi:hypothetical protein
MTDDPGIMRVSLSLPCTVPVVPGTPDADAPIEERTETCNVDAWWIIGIAHICHRHLREVVGIESMGELIAQLITDDWLATVPSEQERLPWSEQHRYEQRPDLLWEGHPHR